MIRIIFTNCKWGTDVVEEGEGGVQINLFDEESQIMAHVPFTGDPLVELATELVSKMSSEQRQKLSVALAEGPNQEPPPEPAAAAPPANGKPKDAPVKPNPFLK